MGDERRSVVMFLGLGSKKIHVMNCYQRPSEPGLAVRVRHLVWKVRSQWRRLAMKSCRQSRMRFGYDPESYSQNFDDGCFY